MTAGSLQDGAAYVVGFGARTPIGCTLRAIDAAVRARLSAVALHPAAVDARGEPVAVARARWIDVAAPLEQRIASLAAEAAQDAFKPLAAHAAALGAPVPVILALAEENVAAPGARELVAGSVASALGLPRSRVAVSLVVEGHAGGVLALERAVEEVQRGRAPFCLAGGADSYVAPDRLLTLSRTDRLHGPEQRWGFSPGEGAGFWAVASGAAAERLGLPVACEVGAVATAREAKLLGAKTVCLGEGLTAALRGVLEAPAEVGRRSLARDGRPSSPRVARWYGDLNGEPYRAEEAAFAILRTREHFDDPGRVRAPAEHWGDVGAASAPLSGALVIASFAREADHLAPGAGATLVFSSSADRPLRGAALFHPASRARSL